MEDSFIQIGRCENILYSCFHSLLQNISITFSNAVIVYDSQQTDNSALNMVMYEIFWGLRLKKYISKGSTLKKKG